MKTNELRIGNYLNSPFGIGQVTGIQDREVTEVDEIGYIIEETPPIPLTEEWLLKFGFKKWKSGYNFSKKRVIVYKHRFCGLCYGKADNRVELKYVHQLQNLYHALSGGEELTIKK